MLKKKKWEQEEVGGCITHNEKSVEMSKINALRSNHTNLSLEV